MVPLYFDGAIIYPSDFDTCATHLRRAIAATDFIELYLEARKFIFQTEEAVYLGHKITAAGIFLNASKIWAAKTVLTLASARELKSFLGLVFYHR